MKKTQLDKDLFYYGDHLELISNFSLSKQLTQKDLGNADEDKAVVQKCYRDIKREKIKCTVIDYLCFISTKLIFATWHHESDKDYKNDKDSLIYKAFQNITYLLLPELKSKISKEANLDLDLTVLWLLFLLVCYENPIHTRNMLRLFRKHPDMVINNNVIVDVMKRMEDKFKLFFTAFNIMNILSFYEFFIERLKNENSETALNKLEYPWKLSVWELTLAYAFKSIVVVDDRTGIVDIFKDKLTKTKKKEKGKL